MHLGPRRGAASGREAERCLVHRARDLEAESARDNAAVFRTILPTQSYIFLNISVYYFAAIKITWLDLLADLVNNIARSAGEICMFAPMRYIDKI